VSRLEALLGPSPLADPAAEDAGGALAAAHLATRLSVRRGGGGLPALCSRPRAAWRLCSNLQYGSGAVGRGRVARPRGRPQAALARSACVAPDRVLGGPQENVSAVGLLHQEMSSVQRQLATAEGAAALAAARADSAEATLYRLLARAEQGGDGLDEDAVRRRTAGQGEGVAVGGAGGVAGGEACCADVCGMCVPQAAELRAHLDAMRAELEGTKVGAQGPGAAGRGRPQPPRPCLALPVLTPQPSLLQAELSAWRGMAEVPPELAGAAAEAVEAAVEAGADGQGGLDPTPGALLLTPAHLNVGSLAVKRAREALAKVRPRGVGGCSH
jgi:hypothetical protein